MTPTATTGHGRAGIYLSAGHSTTDPENPKPVRPTAFREIHKWAGWGDKL